MLPFGGSSFPASIDAYPTVADWVHDILADHVVSLSESVTNIETKLGIDGSAVTTSHDYMLKRGRLAVTWAGGGIGDTAYVLDTVNAFTGVDFLLRMRSAGVDRLTVQADGDLAIGVGGSGILTLGSTDVNKRIIADQGGGGAQPEIRYTAATNIWELSHDGAAWAQIATTTGGGLQSAYDAGATITSGGNVMAWTRGVLPLPADQLLLLQDANASPARTAALLDVQDANVGTGNALRARRSVTGGAAVRAEAFSAGDVAWSSGLVTPTTTAVVFGDGDAVFGGSAMSGTERLRVVGDARIEGAAYITGKLTVDGLIDPTGAVFTEQATVPDGAPAAGDGVFWVKNDAPNTPYFTDDGGTDHRLVYSTEAAPSDAPFLTEGAVAGLSAEVDITAAGADLTTERTWHFAAATGLVLDATGAVAGDNSNTLRFASTVVGPAARNIDVLNEGDALTDTYRLRFNDNAGAQILALEQSGRLATVDGGAANTAIGPDDQTETGLYFTGAGATKAAVLRSAGGAVLNVYQFGFDFGGNLYINFIGDRSGGSNTTIFDGGNTATNVPSLTLQTATRTLLAGNAISFRSTATFQPAAASTATFVGDDLQLTVDHTSAGGAPGSYTAHRIAVTETALGGTGHRLADWAAGGTTRFAVSNRGHVELFEATDPTVAANYGDLYVKDVTGVTELFFANIGTVTQITSGGVLVPGDHGTLGGLGDDDHSQYVHISAARTITAVHTFNPVAPGAAFTLGANATGQLVTGLNADLVDGVDITGLVQTARTLTAGAGLTGGGDLSIDRSFAVGANVDGSITVNADDIQVGVLATDAQHGSRGGGALHTDATGAVAGFMSATDKTRADALWTRILTAGNGLTGGGDLSSDRTFAVGAGVGITVNADDVAVNTAYAFDWQADHQHDKTGVAAGAATQVRSYRSRYTASMWTGAAEAERDIDLYARPSSTVVDENGDAVARLRLDFEGNFLLEIGSDSPSGPTSQGPIFYSNAQNGLNNGFDFRVKSDISSGNTAFRVIDNDDAAPAVLLDVRGDGRVLFGGAGSATGVAVGQIGDPDTGLYSPGADQWACSLGGGTADAGRVSHSATLHTLQRTANAVSGPELRLYLAKTAAAAANDIGGTISFYAHDSVGNVTQAGEINSRLTVVADGGEYGAVDYRIMDGAVMRTIYRIESDGSGGGRFTSFKAAAATPAFYFGSTANFSASQPVIYFTNANYAENPHRFFGKGDVWHVSAVDVAASAPYLELYHSRATPTGDDTCGVLTFSANDSLGNRTRYARLEGIADTVTNGSEAGHIDVFITETGAARLTHTFDADGSFEMYATAATTLGPTLALWHLRAAPLDNDVVGRIDFNGRNDALASKLYASLYGVAVDVNVATGEDGEIQFHVLNNNADRTALRLGSTSNGRAVFYNAAADASGGAFTFVAVANYTGSNEVFLVTDDNSSAGLFSVQGDAYARSYGGYLCDTTGYALRQTSDTDTGIAFPVGDAMTVTCGGSAVQRWDKSAGNPRVGWFGIGPAVRATAYTQTYSTADKTHDTPTSNALPDPFTGGTVGFDLAATRDNIATQFNKLRTEHLDLAQLVNSIIDDLQAYGLLQ